ncbi:MAG: DASS family sodium-coupled anion symporter [Phycisphaeraceae bacterium]|nr:MAG: DASS family sodium-coupled anion symporter [Phycisphaeraceae bacterium]
MGEERPHDSTGRLILHFAPLILGPIAAIAAYLLLPAARLDDAGAVIGGLSHPGRVTAGVGVLMAIYWITEAIPLSVTALFPVTLLPLFGAASVGEAAAPYARDLIFLFFGGFMLGLGIERWGLHRRIALLIVRLIGTSPIRIVGGFMLATAALSAWVSNTATAVLMLPIATSVITLITEHAAKHAESSKTDGVPPLGRNFAVALLLGVAYAASIGGIATLIGTPPNLILAGIAEETLGVEISMTRWMLVATPMVVVFLPIAWLVLTRFVFPIRVKTIPGARRLIDEQVRSLGPMSRGEKLVAIVFACTAAAWIFRPQLVGLGNTLGITPLAGLRDSSVALIAAVAMFVIPVDIRKREFVMDWDTVTRRTPWGVLLLFGGGLSLASAITSTGLDAYIGGHMHALAGLPTWLLVAVLVTAVNFLTELTSNTALTTAILPILVATAPALGVEPLALLVPATMAASFAFMLPVATPPNAIVFGSGKIAGGDMIRAGLALNLIGVVLATIVGTLFSGFVAG